MEDIRNKYTALIALPRKDRIDELVWYLMTKGFGITQRKFGKYLSEPPQVGGYEVDLVAKRSKEYALGVIVTNDEPFNDAFLRKVEILASRKTKYTNKTVPLYLSIPAERLNELRRVLLRISEEQRRNVRLHIYAGAQHPSLFPSQNRPVKSYIN